MLLLVCHMLIIVKEKKGIPHPRMKKQFTLEERIIRWEGEFVMRVDAMVRERVKEATAGTE